MIKNYKKYTLSIGIILVSIFFLSQVSTAQPYACLPTCDVTDGEMLALAAMGLSTSNNRNAEFQITSPPGRQTFEIGIFDGDGTFATWDVNNDPFVILEYKLFLDPEGNGTGNSILIAEWSSDGTFGDNIGDPMPDNDWFVRELENVQQARIEDGSFSYRLEMRNLNPDVIGLNGYKVRSDGTISIPAGSAFNYISSPRGFENFQILYPNLDADDPACFNPLPTPTFCNPLTDPSCCLNPTTYDGSWSFCFVVPEPIDTLNIWDGDFDFGSSSRDSEGNCIKPDGVDLDTDDPNTPIPLPEWALNTDAITQSASIPTEPADDNGCSNLTVRPPSVIYDLLGPNGEVYTNVNPSGNIEWELFNISTLPFNPDLYDIPVENIDPGLWCVKTFGNDMQNLNSLRLPYAVLGVDDEGNPVFPGEPPTDVPTLNQWGIMILSLVILFMSIVFMRRQRKITQ